MKAVPKIGITMGDPAGIGPELCLRVLEHQGLLQECCPIIFGNATVLKRVGEATGLPFAVPMVPLTDLSNVGGPCLVDCPFPGCDSIVPAQVQADGGAAAFAFIEAAITSALSGDIAAVTTAPVHKEALR